MGANEFEPQDYFPACRITLSVRFDEFSDPKPTADAKLKFKKPPIKMTGKNDSTASLVVADDPNAPSGTLRKLITYPSGPGKAPADAVASADKYTFDLGGITPKNLTLGLNGARKASVLSVTIRYIDCPIDPRTIRSCAVSCYLGTLTQEAFEAMVTGAPGEQANLLPSTYVDDEGRQRTNLRFQGWVDEWEMAWDDEGQPLIKLECRDNTTLLDAQQHPPKMVLDMTLPLHEAVANYLKHFDQFAGLTVEYRPGSATPPKVKDALAKTAFRPNLGPPASKGGGGGGKTSALDYITDVCGAVGHIIYVEGTTLVIRQVRSLTGSEFAGRPDDPYQGRSLPSGDAKFRRFIYGRNIKSMSCKRKFARAAPTNVEVRSYNPARKGVLVARFPTKNSPPIQHPQPGDGKEQKWAVHYVAGITDQATLDKIAQGYYESVGRGEIEVDVKTKNLAAFGGGNLDPDILDMLAGDTFEVLVNRDEDELNSMTKIETLLAAQGRVQEFMKAIGYSGPFVDAYAKAFTHTAFPTLFRLRHLGIAWDSDEGVQLTLQGINYVEVEIRNDQKLPDDEEVKP